MNCSIWSKHMEEKENIFRAKLLSPYFCQTKHCNSLTINHKWIQHVTITGEGLVCKKVRTQFYCSAVTKYFKRCHLGPLFINHSILLQVLFCNAKPINIKSLRMLNKNNKSCDTRSIINNDMEQFHDIVDMF